jgi:hypothetical protein
MIADEPGAMRKSVWSFSAKPASGTVMVAVFQVFVPWRLKTFATWCALLP